MFVFRSLTIGGLLALLVGCAPMPAEMSLDSSPRSARDAGLIVGSLVDGGPYGTWIGFRHLQTGQAMGWGAKDLYSAWLPAGDYEVQEMGSRRGTMGPFGAPLRFTVKQGEINYLGELLYNCPEPIESAARYGVMQCGLFALGTCKVTYASARICIVNRQESALRSFLKEHPEHSALPVRSALMSGGNR